MKIFIPPPKKSQSNSNKQSYQFHCKHRNIITWIRNLPYDYYEFENYISWILGI